MSEQTLGPCTQAELDAWTATMGSKNAQLFLMWVDRAQKAEAALAAARPDREGLEAEVTRLQKGIQDHLDGNYDHPRKYRSQGPQSTCPHHRYYYEECGECNDAHLKSLLHLEQEASK